MTVREFLICSIGLRPPFCVLILTFPPLAPRRTRPLYPPVNSPFTNQPTHHTAAPGYTETEWSSYTYTIPIHVYCIYWIYEKGTRNLFTPSRPVPFILIKFPRAKTNIYLYCDHAIAVYILYSFSRENRLLIPLSFGWGVAGVEELPAYTGLMKLYTPVAAVVVVAHCN